MQGSSCGLARGLWRLLFPLECNDTIFCRFIVDSLPMGLHLEVVDAIASEFSPWTGLICLKFHTICISGYAQDQLQIAGVCVVRIIFPRSCGWQPWGDLVTSPRTRIYVLTQPNLWFCYFNFSSRCAVQLWAESSYQNGALEGHLLC